MLRPQGKRLVPGVIANTDTLITQATEDNDLTTITNASGEIFMASNASAQIMREDLAALNKEMVSLKAAVVAGTHSTTAAYLVTSIATFQ